MVLGLGLLCLVLVLDWFFFLVPITADYATLTAKDNGQHSVMLCGWEIKAWLMCINVWMAGKAVWSLVNTCQPERPRDEHFLKFFFHYYFFCFVPCCRLTWLFVSFWAHVNIVYRARIVHYKALYKCRVFFTLYGVFRITELCFSDTEAPKLIPV